MFSDAVDFELSFWLLFFLDLVAKCNLPKENGVDERHINMRINQPASGMC